MNNKGFTLIELITTFVLSSIIVMILINIIIIIKETYVKSNVKSNLIVEQSNLSYLINSKFNSSNLINYEPCFDTDFCFTFDFDGEQSSKLMVGDNYITFDNYTYKLSEETNIGKSSFEIVKIDTSTDDVNNSFLVIKIPITNSLYSKEDFGINFVYQYNSNLIELE